MKAVLNGHVIAESNDIVECDGYHYFPTSAVRLQWLEKAPKTESDRACPHGVQFYDVVIDGERHARVEEFTTSLCGALIAQACNIGSSR